LRRAQTELDFKRLAGGDCVIPPLPHLAGVVRMNRAVEGGLTRVLWREPCVVDPALVEIIDAAVFGRRPNQLRHRFGDPAELVV